MRFTQCNCGYEGRYSSCRWYLWPIYRSFISFHYPMGWFVVSSISWDHTSCYKRCSEESLHTNIHCPLLYLNERPVSPEQKFALSWSLSRQALVITPTIHETGIRLTNLPSKHNHSIVILLPDSGCISLLPSIRQSSGYFEPNPIQLLLWYPRFLPPLRIYCNNIMYYAPNMYSKSPPNPLLSNRPTITC